jgi:hypothetical protein
MDPSDFGSKGLSAPTILSRKGHVSSLKVDICPGAFWLEILLDCFEESLHLMDFRGIDSLRGIVRQLRRDHCRVKLLTVVPLLCILVFHWRSCSIFGDGRDSNELVDLLVSLGPVVGIVQSWDSIIECVQSELFKLRNVGHDGVRCSSALKNSELDLSLMMEEPRPDGLTERASRPKSSRLDMSLGWLETTEGLRSDKSGVGE